MRSTEQESSVGIGGVVIGQEEKDLLDYSMDSEDGSVGGKVKEDDKSILDTAGEDESMDTADRQDRQDRQDGQENYIRINAGELGNRDEDVFMTPAEAKEAEERMRTERRRKAEELKEKVKVAREADTLKAEEERKREEQAEKDLRRMRRVEKNKAELEKRRLLMENAQAAKQLGREAGGKAKIDHRYYAVRSLRGARPSGRELNRQADEDSMLEKNVGHVLVEGFVGGGGDERWLRNYNIHNLETQLNISCSFNRRSGFCYTCKGELHSATQGRNGEAVAFVISDQSFPANVWIPIRNCLYQKFIYVSI